MSNGARARGVALLEVVAGLTIFVIAAVFVLDGLNASLRSVRHARLEADAADLTVTVLSEVQMGVIEIRNEGPSAFSDELFPGWTWQLIVTDVEDLPDLPLLRRVEVIVRNEQEAFTNRTTQLIWDDPAQQTGAASGELEGAAQQLTLPGGSSPQPPQEGAP